MNLLITGGAGFIGSHYIEYMLQHYPHYHVINLDALTYAGHERHTERFAQHPNYTFIKGNIADQALVEQLLQQYEVAAIVNFAAESHVDRSIRDPHIFIQSNVVGTHVLLHAALTHGVDRYIQISTDEVYGSLGKMGKFTEQTPLAPNSPYSASKASADLLVRAYYETYGLPALITRCSNNYGPYQYPEKLIPHLISRALADEPLPIYGDGENVRDWLHVVDHCRAIDLVLHQGQVGEVYNIGGDNEWTNNKIAQLIVTELEKPASLIKHVEDRLGHDRRYAIDATKIKTELGWQPAVSFKKGLRETIAWYVEHREWLQK